MSVDRIDLKIVESLKKGNNAPALAYLYDKPLKKIKKYILSNDGTTDDALDVFQDAVIILFNQIKKDKYNVNQELEGFLFVVARNLWIDKVRREKRKENRDFTVHTQQSDTINHLDDMIGKEKSEVLQKVFQQLDERCRDILHFSIYEKLSMKEISQKMGYLNENVAKTNHYRCKQSLAKLVKENAVILSVLKN